jgi:hypothetical protein
MNRAFLIVGIPAFATSFCWVAYGWGWRLAAAVTGIELAVAVATVFCLLRQQDARPHEPRADR